MPDVVIDKILAATRPEEVFGIPPEDGREPDFVSEVWRTLSRAVHPDRNTDPRANDAMSRLNVLYTAATNAVATGSYGKGPVMVDAVTIQTRRHAYRVTNPVITGDVCNVYAATYTDDEGEHDGLVKVVRNRRDGDLVANEARTLKRLLSAPDVYDHLYPYLPGYKEAFGYRSHGEKRPRQGIAFSLIPDLYTLEQVREAFPQGVHAKDAAWMFRRLLWALSFIHRIGYVHGAILPRHVLIEPDQHGIVLVDWKYSVPVGQRMTAIPTSHREAYPHEVIDKVPVGPGTDIFMAARCMAYVMGGSMHEFPTVSTFRIPKQIRAFLAGTALPQLSRRPNDALVLRDEYTELIERLWGPRTFRPFVMP